MRMRIAALRARLSSFLTARRRRQGLIVLAVLGAYGLLGTFALPGVVVSEAQRYVHDKLHLELAIERMELNPWLLAVRIHGVSIREPGPGGETLVAARQLYVNAQLWSSLWLRGASLAALELDAPRVNARIRRDGSINLMQLVPPDDQEDSGEARWRIGQLTVAGGRIDFRDDTRPTPFTTTFAPLNLGLSDLSSRPDRDGLYTLHAETGDGEALDWRGNLAMQPVRSEGELRISGLRATTPWRYLQDQLPVVVEHGSIGISGHYRLAVDNGAQFSLTDGRVTVDDLRLHLRDKAPLALQLKGLALAGARFDWPAQDAGFQSLQLDGLSLQEPEGPAPLARLGQLTLQDVRYGARGQRADIARLALKDIHLADGSDDALMVLPGLALERIGADLGHRQAGVDRIELNKGAISLRREADGRLNWGKRLEWLTQRLQQGLVTPVPTMAASAAAGEASVAVAPRPGRKTTGQPHPPEPAWQARLGELELQDFRVAVDDLQPITPVATSLEHIHLRVLPSQKPGEAHRLEGSLQMGTGGSLSLTGNFAEQPLAASADVKLEGVKLPPFAPYFADLARFALEDGALDLDGRMGFRQGTGPEATFRGQLALRNFSANDLDQDERFLAWKRLGVQGIDWRLAPGRLAIREIVAERPFMRLIMGSDKTLNLSHIIVSAPEPGVASMPSVPAAAPAPAASSATTSATLPAPATKGQAEPPYPLRIDRIRFVDGSMLFADLTLKPQFATGIQDLTGDVTGISSAPDARATVDLKGRVDQFGRATISGALTPLASDRFTDLKVHFSDLELTTLTPYSAKFAGYRIDKGKLSLDLGYQIRERRLEATNKIVFNQLTLGDKVDSPDATSLPLKLAVAILKDKDGVIDVDLPLSGSLDDPQFRIGPVVWKAFVNLLTRAATAPFSLIAGLVGGGEDMDAIGFDPGAAVLAPEQAQKLGKLAGALAQRPGLGVEIRGAFDPVADAIALREARFEAAYQKRLANGDKARKVLESLFAAKLGDEALARQRALSLKPAEGGDLKLADAIYLEALRKELVARETILDGDLRQLALERARVLRAQLVDGSGVDAARIFVLEPVSVAAVGGKVVLKVGLSAG